ncbi:hypothetical protein ACIOMM_35945 [Streptomyces sp. NPDC087908]|uniref:hypothetical protein n=1 Tax=Streptomyces sp. NPDC087908 TaxID=3365820 RepID=UPI0038084FC9
MRDKKRSAAAVVAMSAAIGMLYVGTGNAEPAPTGGEFVTAAATGGPGGPNQPSSPEPLFKVLYVNSVAQADNITHVAQVNCPAGYGLVGYSADTVFKTPYDQTTSPNSLPQLKEAEVTPATRALKVSWYTANFNKWADRYHLKVRVVCGKGAVG